MEKLKKIKLTNQMKWAILVIIILITLAVLSIIRAVSYTKTVSANTKMEVSNKEVNHEEVIDQANLVDTSKMSLEELKKLNEEEQKKAEEKKKEEEKKQNNATNKTTKPKQNKYYIKVNYGAQVVTVYTYDKNGKYTVPVKACVCSTGAATPVSGVYRTGWKSNWGALYGNVWGQYCTQIVGDILFHSVPYKQNKKDTLVSAYYDRLGTKDSMGCIRLTTIDALWLFNNCPSGTQVEFYSSSNPGPLGKPTARKVSGAPGKLKNWDPTDPDTRNPWRTYKPSQNDNKKPNTNTTTNNNTNTTVNNVTDTNTIQNTIVNNTENVPSTNTEENNNQITNNTQGNVNTENNESTNTQINEEVTNTGTQTGTGDSNT